MNTLSGIVLDEFIYESKFSGRFKAVYYLNSRNVAIIFENGGSTVTTAKQVLNGEVKNKFKPSVCDIGFFGEGNFNGKEAGKLTREYTLWVNMMKRCYRPQLSEINYLEVEVHKDWHNFQNFAKWCHSQNGFKLKDKNGEFLQLDKDILSTGRKIYSPDTCCFVPRKINSFLTAGEKRRGLDIIGVRRCGKTKFKVRCSADGESQHLGVFDDEYSAFLAYKNFKENLAKSYVKEYSHLLEEKVITALQNFTVQILD